MAADAYAPWRPLVSIAMKNWGPQRIFLAVAASAATFLFVWFQWRLLLLTFAGLLLAILLRSAIAWIERHTPLRPTLAYAATVGALAGLATLIIVVLGPRIINQLSQVFVAIPAAMKEAQSYLDQQPWGQTVLRVAHQALSGSATESHLTLAAKALVNGAVDSIVILVIGLFGALNPRSYREGLLLLLPAQYRQRAREIGSEVAETLRLWLLGQLVPMTAIGIASMISLWALGVRLAFAVGLLTGLLIFVPYAGSIFSGLLAALLGFDRSPVTGLYILMLYVIFHVIEGYFLTPLVQRRAVRLPPVLTVLSQFFLYSFAGVLGVAVAAPLAATGITLIRSFHLVSDGNQRRVA
ncbi:MAG TPA: AI-2E family transporter [Acidobacteriaceae bacterium]|nr:AI-2E family transporter [Acidobacteriaceae bacterium]